MVERVIAVLSGLLTIILGLLTIYTFRWGKGKKKTNKLALLLITISLIVITICVFTLPYKDEGNPELQTNINNQDSLTEKVSPIVNTHKPIKRNEEIVSLVREARKLRSVSVTESLNIFRKAYDLLPETQKDEGFINSMEGYRDFGTQVNLFDNYFKLQNY